MSGKAILKEIGSTLLYIVVVLGITWLVITFVGQPRRSTEARWSRH